MLLLIIVFRVCLPANSVKIPTLYFKAQDKILADGYPVEIHHVTTEDGYILEMQRIPYSLKNKKRGPRPAVYMQHGFLASGDNYVLADRNQALGYLAADAGYDVWLGNNRGIFYSKKHVHYKIVDPSFWNFSFTEIALFDLPASFDYILNLTKQKHLHYVGHSQGTSIYFILLSERPEYNFKIKSGHMLAPVAFFRNPKTLLTLIGPIFGKPDPKRLPFTSFDFLPRIKPINALLANLCAQPIFLPICLVFVSLYVGPTKMYTNQSLVPELLANFPAGSSFNQLIHLAQLISSKRFQKFDWGPSINVEMYGRKQPPSFAVEKIQAPTFFYYSSGDFLSSEMDVRFFLKLLNKKAIAGTKFYGDGKWNHFDYLAAKHLDTHLNIDIIRNMRKYEG